MGNKKTDINIGDFSSDEKWREVLILYSGLIDSEESKSEFIEKIKTKDPVLAAKCLTSDWKNKYSIEEDLIEEAKRNLPLIYLNNGRELGERAYLTLLELGRINELLDIIKNPPVDLISLIKSNIPRILDISKNNLKEIINELLERNPGYFLRQVFDYLSEISEQKNLLIEIFYKYSNRHDVKYKHLFSIVKLFGTDYKFEIDKNLQIQFVKHIRQYNDLLFVQRSVSFSLKFREIFEIISKEAINPSVGFLMLDLFKSNSILRKAILDTYLKDIGNSNKINDKALAMLLYIYFYPDSNSNRLSFLRNRKYVVSQIQTKDGFYGIFMKIVDELQTINDLSKAKAIIGKKFKVVIQSEWMYHYYIKLNNLKITLVLPKSEVEKPLLEGAKCDIVITYFDEKNEILFCSSKQYKKTKGSYAIDLDDLKVARIGDKLKAKIVKVNGKINCKVLGIGKKAQVKILNPDFFYKEYTNLYHITVVGINNFNKLNVRVERPVK